MSDEKHAAQPRRPDPEKRRIAEAERRGFRNGYVKGYNDAKHRMQAKQHE